MARETKVGLIVGLGVILFVGVFVSDYLSVPQNQEELATQHLADFHHQTTNQPQLINRDGESPANAPERLPAAAALDQLEERFGSPVARTPIDEPLYEPPFRTIPSPGIEDPALDVTPIAGQPYVAPGGPVGALSIDERRLAAGNQLPVEPVVVRVGPGVDPLEPFVRVEIPETPLITPQPRLQLHTVRSGETLTAIARKHYDGDGNMWRSIRDANPGKVGPNGEVVEGAELVIPKRSALAGDPAAELSPRAVGENQRPARQRVRMIKVKEGQTLSEIAYEHLGAGNKWPLIMAVNDDVLDKPEQLRAGMQLRIPAEEVAEVIEEANNALVGAVREPEAPQPAPAAASTRTYTVKAGDSLYRIAAKKLGDGERFTELFAANRDRLSSADDIRVGMELTLPAR